MNNQGIVYLFESANTLPRKFHAVFLHVKTRPGTNGRGLASFVYEMF